MRYISTLTVLLLMAASHNACSQAITMKDVISLSRQDVKKTAEYMAENKWKAMKAARPENQELSDVHGKYAHFTNCFFMLPEYKKKFKTEPGKKQNGIFRDIYVKSNDSIFVYYYNIDEHQYPLGLIYKTNRAKLQKITAYLKHNKYTQTFTRDSTEIYEIRKSVENITLDKRSSTGIEYYIDRCWKYADGHRKPQQQ